MEQEPSPLETLAQQATDYGKLSVELIKLKSVDKTADLLSTLLTGLTIALFLLLCLLFASIGLACWLGELLGKTYYGFLITGAFYAFIAWVLFLLRDRILKQPISNFLITQLLNSKDV